MQLLVADTVELEEGASYGLHFAALYCTRLQLSLETRDPAIRCQGGGQWAVGRGDQQHGEYLM